MTTAKVWFITGASRGLGRAFVESALDAGDRVVAVARDTAPLDELAEEHGRSLVRFALDVADRGAVFAVVPKVFAAFGTVDVVVNNAGGMLYGMVEEATEEQIRAHLDVNFFGAVWVAQAALTRLRAQGFGHLLQVTSMAAGAGMASVGFYGAGKAALASLTEAMAMEVAGLGIKVTNVEMGGYATGLFTTGATATEPLPHYDALRDELARMWGTDAGPDPSTAAPVIRELAALADPPRRLIVGSVSYDQVHEMNEARAAVHREWEQLSRMAPG
ncbi:SDR family NAD(P)-dependent oxidoreductase [Nocardia callitridis]|uniref:SDR family NAD(P)-dependent oxidoreductase n=1 Tax=Nocardia callitridis TaxID=648753 RepID=A0ABP9KC83_9NOCA